MTARKAGDVCEFSIDQRVPPTVLIGGSCRYRGKWKLYVVGDPRLDGEAKLLMVVGTSAANRKMANGARQAFADHLRSEGLKVIVPVGNGGPDMAEFLENPQSSADYAAVVADLARQLNEAGL